MLYKTTNFYNTALIEWQLLNLMNIIGTWGLIEQTAGSTWDCSPGGKSGAWKCVFLTGPSCCGCCWPGHHKYRGKKWKVKAKTKQSQWLWRGLNGSILLSPNYSWTNHKTLKVQEGGNSPGGSTVQSSAVRPPLYKASIQTPSRAGCFFPLSFLGQLNLLSYLICFYINKRYDYKRQANASTKPVSNTSERL